jgi:DNA polymerase I
MRLFGGVRYVDAPCPNNVGRLDHGALPMISQMRQNGIRLDCPYLHSLSLNYHTQQSDLESEVRRHIGDYQYSHSKHGRLPFSIGSRDHLSQLFFEHLRIQGDAELARTPSGKRFEVSEDVLSPYKKSHPVVPLVLRWHMLDKLLNTYIDTLPRLVDSDSRLHTQFNATVAATGRLSSSRPNLQNVPTRSKEGREIRRAFIASPNCLLVSSDLSQIEMRIAAHGSRDPNMVEVFRKGEDIHAKTACGIFGRDYYDVMTWDQNSDRFKKWKKEERAPSKNLGFGVLYGLTAEGLQRNIMTESEGEVVWEVEKCQSFIDQFFRFYPKLLDLMQLQYRRARRFAMVWDMFGRVRLVPEAKSCHKRISNEGERKAGNHYEQSSAQGVIKLSMAEMTGVVADLSKSFKCLSLLQIHDELIHDVDRQYAEEFGYVCQHVFEHAAPLNDGIPTLSSKNLAETWADL